MGDYSYDVENSMEYMSLMMLFELDVMIILMIK